MNEEDDVLGWYEPYLLTLWFGRSGAWYDAKTIALGAIGFAAPVAVEWVFAGSRRMPLFKMLPFALAMGIALYLVSPLTEILPPAYFKVSPEFLSRSSLGGSYDMRLTEIKACRLFSLRVLGRPYDAMIICPLKGKDIVIGISPALSKSALFSAFERAQIHIEYIAQDA